MNTISRETFKKAVSYITGYDVFIEYIDNGRQYEQAVRFNCKMDDYFTALMQEVGIDYKGVPYELTNMYGEELYKNLTDWFNKHGYEVEKEQQEEPKQQKKVWTEEEIKMLIQTNDEVLYRALKKLYECQTDDEKRTQTTKVVNGAGFNGVDAPILSSMTEFLKRTGFLTFKQKALARKKLVKYTKQLTRIANI